MTKLNLRMDGSYIFDLPAEQLKELVSKNQYQHFYPFIDKNKVNTAKAFEKYHDNDFPRNSVYLFGGDIEIISNTTLYVGLDTVIIKDSENLQISFANDEFISFLKANSYFLDGFTYTWHDDILVLPFVENEKNLIVTTSNTESEVLEEYKLSLLDTATTPKEEVVTPIGDIVTDVNEVNENPNGELEEIKQDEVKSDLNESEVLEESTKPYETKEEIKNEDIVIEESNNPESEEKPELDENTEEPKKRGRPAKTQE